MAYASRLSPEAKLAEHMAALRRAARALKTPADLENYLLLAPAADRDGMRDILTPLCLFSTETPRG